MCVVSAVSDYYTRPYQQIADEWNDLIKNPIPMPAFPPVKDMSDEIRKELAEVIKRLDKIDKKLNDIECHDDAKKQFLTELKLTIDQNGNIVDSESNIK